jgi:hypothetical protein
VTEFAVRPGDDTEALQKAGQPDTETAAQHRTFADLFAVLVRQDAQLLVVQELVDLRRAVGSP